MSRRSRSLVKAALCLVLLMLAVLPLRSLVAQNGAVEDHAGGPQDLVQVVLHAGPAPAVGGTALLTLEATPFAAAPDFVLQWQVPEGVELLGAAEQHFGPVSAGEPVSSAREVRFVQEGLHKIAATAMLDYGPDAQFAASGVVFYTIQPGTSSVSDKDPTARSPMRSKMAAQITTSAPDMAPNAVNGDPCFTVAGTVTRWELTPQPGGYKSSFGVPVRNARVEIRESDTIWDDTYAELNTDSSGYFEYAFCDDDGAFGGDNLELYVRLRAEIYEGSHKVAEIEDSSWIDEIYEYDSEIVSSSGGTLLFDFELDVDQSAVFNIGDAILDAYRLWRDSGGEAGGDSLFDGVGEVHWEPGYGDTGSYYFNFPGWDEITIADDPSDPDAWDDSVIIHEWGHMADDYYSCDDNPGGDHFIGALAASTDLAWGEGYPDYWQSAVRAAAGQPYASHYLDINGSGTSGINVNLEATQPAALVSVRYEMAIAAALWDLFDAVDDDQDIVTLGHAPLQAVYTGDEFEDTSFGYFDDTCTFDTYMKAWVAAGEPTDALTAAAIAQNTGYTLPPQNIALASSSALESQSVPGPTFGAWWNEMTYVVDRSKSMAGARLDAVKAVLAESINDLSNEPAGTEFSLLTLDSGGYGADPLFAGQFFPERLTPVVNGLSASATADNSCENTALSQFYQAMLTREGGQAWLFTDGVPVPYPNAEAIKQALNEREINASVALLAGCDPAETSADLQTADATGRVQMEGALTRVLGETAAADVPQGIVPYLLMAINSGGRFLYVDPAQIDDAAAILRAQITHSAGAGTWSDYVSDQATYRWQELASWEYSWIDAAGAGTNHGQPASNSYVDVPLPNAFTYFGAGPYSAARAYEKGYIALGSPFDALSQASNTTLPNTKQPNNTLYPYWDNLDWVVFCIMDADAPDCTAPPRGIYSKQEGQWFAIEQKGYYATSYAGYLDFQTQLNLQTGEIRFLYNDLDGVGAPSATIGLENAGGTSAVQVSYNDVAGAADGMGYKFIPAPPQPTRTFTAVVDQHMDGIAFLLTGYSGTFEDLLVKTPDGQPISCADTAAVYCLDLGLVQYVQANVNGRYGEWQAVVDAGPSGEGTFSLFSMAASAISASGLSPHSLSTGLGAGIVTNMGGPLGGKQLSARFVQPNGQPFGVPFTLYDDGDHGDGRAADGIFGSGPYTPPGPGSAYLHLQGTHLGAPFERVDPVPFTFQPLLLESLGSAANSGGTSTLQFRLTNLDTAGHDYSLSPTLPTGWTAGISQTVSLNPGQTVVLDADITMGPQGQNLPSGASGEVFLSAIEQEQGVMTASASATVSRRRPPVQISIFNDIPYLRPGGEKAVLDFFVTDAQGTAVADGTQVNLSATKGTIIPATAVTRGGAFAAEFTSGAAAGTAVITASVPDIALNAAVTAQTKIPIGSAPPNGIVLTAQHAVLVPGGQTLLTARVTNRYGEPVAGQMVRIGVSGDGQNGTVGSAQEVVSGSTNANGVFSATFTAGTRPGSAQIRAELLTSDGAEPRVVHDAHLAIDVSGGLHLPVIMKP